MGDTILEVHIGLITGLGPAATVAYYQRLTSSAAARGHRPRARRPRGRP